MNKIEINEENIKSFSKGITGHAVLRCLAMSWEDANEYRSVKQNSAQRKQMIEYAMKDYIFRLTPSEIDAICVKLSS